MVQHFFLWFLIVFLLWLFSVLVIRGPSPSKKTKKNKGKPNKTALTQEELSLLLIMVFLVLVLPVFSPEQLVEILEVIHKIVTTS